MANIAITNYCNLKCPYCFAEEMIQEDKENISIEQFKSISQWCAQTPTERLGIIGGEPTIHPQFSDILKEINAFFREYNTCPIIFTNGINLKKYVHEIGDGVRLLINYNNPANMSAEQFQQLTESLEYIYLLNWFKDRASLGVNLYLDCNDYSFIWEAYQKYQASILRVSVTTPGGQYLDWKQKKEEYYLKMKPIFLKFIAEAKQYSVNINMDCNRIPECYFSAEELDEIKSIIPNYSVEKTCEPVIDITPQFCATACFGAYDPVDCTNFQNLEELRKYLKISKTLPRALGNGYGKCATCDEHALLQCQGGCLGFARMDK